MTFAMAGPASQSVLACPMCRAANETDDPQPRAYMYSILFMMGTVTCVFGAVTVVLYKVGQREALAMQTSGLSDAELPS